MNFCTIIAKNYLAYARVLARSLADQHPGCRVWTLIIDDFSSYIEPSKESFEVLTPQQIGCEPFTHMALRYSVLELSTAVKPWLLRYLMSETGAPVTYLDPDIKAFGSLAALDELASRHGVVLIPHNIVPIPADGRRPSQVDIMIAGIYNLGYVSLAPSGEVDKLLDWWADRLRRDCRVDPVWGYFVDQRWFDLCPGFLSDLAIVRDPQYNLAYWNLHSRRLEYEHGRYVVDGRPLAFFHFSGFDPGHPLILSRHQDRIDVAEHPALSSILADYAMEVLSAGHAVSREWPYSFAALADGTQLDDLLRSLYDEYADEHDEQVPSPFTLEGARMFGNWLHTSASGGPPGVNRVLARVYDQRADLRSAFPDIAGADRAGLFRWVREHGGREVPLLGTMMTSNGSAELFLNPGSHAESKAVSDTERTEPIPHAPWGVNLVGSFDSVLDEEAHARLALQALDAAEMPTLPIRAPSPSGVPDASLTIAPDDAPFPLNLICVGPGTLPEFAAQAGRHLFAGRYSIGFWWWEVNRFPERWRSSFSFLEEVWVPSQYVADAIGPVATVPVNAIRLPVQPPLIEPLTRSELGLPEDEFVFLFSFDDLSAFQRKNPLAVIEAFRRGFSPGEGACLVVSTSSAERDPAFLALMRDAAATHPDVHLLDGGPSPSAKHSLLAQCDCFVSLHRAESFGLTIAEAMSIGKPVIATGYSGNLDFMTAGNSLLVEYELRPVGPDAAPYPADAVWAEPDLDHAAALMRGVVGDRAGARNLGATASTDIGRTHSPKAAGDVVYRRLESIRATGRVTSSRGLGVKRPPRLAALPLRVGQGPTPRPGISSARHRFYRLLLRLLRPYTTYQRRVNEELVAALEELNRAILELRRELAADRAHTLSELRRHDDLRIVSGFVESQQRRISELERTVQELERSHRNLK